MVTVSPGRRGLPRHCQAVCVCISQGDWIAEQLLCNPYFWEGNPRVTAERWEGLPWVLDRMRSGHRSGAGCLALGCPTDVAQSWEQAAQGPTSLPLSVPLSCPTGPPHSHRVGRGGWRVGI